MRIRNPAIRIMLLVLFVEVVMSALLVSNGVRMVSYSNSRQFEENAKNEMALLINMVATGLIYADRAMLEDDMDLLTQDPRLVYAAVYNNHGKLMASVGEVPARQTPDADFEQALSDGVFDAAADVVVSDQHLGRVEMGVSVRGIQAFSRELQLQGILIAAGELLLTMLLTVWVGLRMARRVDELQLGATQLRYGHLAHRVPVEGDDELAQLGSTLNQLASHLERTQNELEQERRALQTETERLNSLVNSVNAVIFEADAGSMDFNFVSHEAGVLLDYPESDWYRHGFWNRIIHQEDRVRFWSQIGAVGKLPADLEIDYRVYNQDGKLVWVRFCATLEAGRGGQRLVRGFLLDITEEKHAQERVTYLAEHDALTSLFNRHRFKQELERALAYCKRYQRCGALLFIDIDQFKYVNDTLGHQAGDRYLMQVADCLRNSLRESDILARLGGDEFGVILTEGDSEHSRQVAEGLIEKLNRTDLHYQDIAIQVSASIGIALFPQHGDKADELLARADSAMYTAKHDGRNRLHLYSDDDSDLQSMVDIVHWENEIRDALKEDRFLLYFQPIVDLAENRVKHYEVLLRLRGRDGSLVLPGAFLDTAEGFGLIREIDTWVVTHSLRFLAEWRPEAEVRPLAINLSGRYFGSDSYLAMIKAALQDTAVDPQLLIFEVTETAAIENISAAQRFIHELRTLGCRFALDDFGVGFASFQYLKHLELDFVKVDGSFIRNLHQDAQDLAFVRAIYDMAEGLGIQVIAEFVENQEIIYKLQEIGVHLGQGFHLARPAPSPVLPVDSAVS